MLPVASSRVQAATKDMAKPSIIDADDTNEPQPMPDMDAAHHAAPAAAPHAHEAVAGDGMPHPLPAGAVEEQARTLQLLEAHDLAARAAATAAGFMRLGESVPQAVADAQLVMDAPGSVDADSGVVSMGQSTEPEQHPSAGLQQDLAHAQLPSPPAEVVRQVLHAMLGQPGSEHVSSGHAPALPPLLGPTATPAASRSVPSPAAPPPAAAAAAQGTATAAGLPAPRPAGGVVQSNKPDSSVASVASVAGSATPSIDVMDWAHVDTASSSPAAAVATKQPEQGVSIASTQAPSSLLRTVVTTQASRAAAADKPQQQESQTAAAQLATAEQQQCLPAAPEVEPEQTAETTTESPGFEQGTQMMQMAAHVLGAQECITEQTSEDTAPSSMVPAQLIGGTGLGAHSGGSTRPATGASAFEGAARMAGTATSSNEGRHGSNSLPATPHPTPLGSFTPALLSSVMVGANGQQATQPADGATRPARDRTPVRTRSLGPEELISPVAAAAAAGFTSLRLRVPASPGLSMGSAPPSITSCGGMRRPPTPVPSRMSSSSLASPMHSARASHTSLDEELTDMLPALEEEGALGSASSSSARLQDAVPEWYTPSTSPALPLDGEGSGQLPSELSMEPALPMFFPPPPEEAQQLMREGAGQSPHGNGRHMQAAHGSSADESQLATPHSTPMDGATSGVLGSVAVPESEQTGASTAQVLCSAARQLEHEAAGTTMDSRDSSSSSRGGAVGAAGGRQPSVVSHDASEKHAQHQVSTPASTGMPQMDAQPTNTAAVFALQEQMALHSYMGRAAAIAGALVHSGQTPARAANLAEAAMDPADVVDFTDARTNMAQPDTLPDMMAAQRTGLAQPQEQYISTAAAAGSPTTHVQQLAPHTPERTAAATHAHVAASADKPQAETTPAAAAAEAGPLAAMVEAVKGAGAAATEPVLSPPEESLPGTVDKGAAEAAEGEVAADGDAREDAVKELGPGWTEPLLHIYKARVGGGVVWERHQDEELDDSARLPRAPPPSFIEPRSAEPEGGRSYSFQVHGAHAAAPPGSRSQTIPRPASSRMGREPDTPPSSPTHLSFSTPSGQAGPGLPRLPSRLGSILGGVTPSASFGNTAMASFSAGLGQPDEVALEEQEAEMEEAMERMVEEEEEEGEAPSSQPSFPRLPPVHVPAAIITPRETHPPQAVAPLTPPQGPGLQHMPAAPISVPLSAVANLGGDDAAGADMLAMAEAAAAEAGLPPPSPRLLKQLQQLHVFGHSPTPLADEEIPRSVRAATPPRSVSPTDAAAQPAHTSGKQVGAGEDTAAGEAVDEDDGPTDVVLLDSVSDAPRSPRTPRSEHEVVPLL